MIKHLLFLITVFSSTFGFTQNPVDYFDYHSKINEADSLIFILDKPEEGVSKYDTLFEEYDKIFTKDLINAHLLSEHFQLDTFNFKRYLNKTQFHHVSDGIVPSLKTPAPTFQDSVIRSQVNFNLRNRILELCAYDQATKSYPYKSFERKKLYDTVFAIIQREGFPSEFNAGLDDPLLTVRARLPHKSLEKYWKALKLTKHINLKEKPEIIGFRAINLIMIHNPCAYNRLYNLLKENISSGNIHPGEVALYYDNQFRFPKQVNSDCPESFDSSIYFDHNSFAKPPSAFDTDKTNSARHKIGLPSVSLNAAKRLFSTTTRVPLYWGFWEST